VTSYFARNLEKHRQADLDQQEQDRQSEIDRQARQQARGIYVPPPTQPPTAPPPLGSWPPGYSARPPFQTDPVLLAIAWVIAVLTFLYMLPWAVAVSRHKANHGAIALVNLLTGWTVVGWIAALVMACV
jgi:hypothetical protein